jgi:predicted transcriptional regulator
MKTLNVGIMPREEFQKRTIAIASGDYKPQKDEPKIWFNSMKSLGEILSESNVKLLRLIDSENPESIKKLSEISGRESSNLSRTLKTLERYSIIELIRHNKMIKPIVKANDFNIHYSIAG